MISTACDHEPVRHQPDGTFYCRRCAAPLDQPSATTELRDTYFVVRVNRDPLDTHAAETFESALDLAMPDDGDRIDYGTVQATDAGAARLMKPREWHLYTTGAFGAMSDPSKAQERNAGPTCYYNDTSTCSGPLWVCRSCGESFCQEHGHVSSAGVNVECVACERAAALSAERDIEDFADGRLPSVLDAVPFETIILPDDFEPHRYGTANDSTETLQRELRDNVAASLAGVPSAGRDFATILSDLEAAELEEFRATHCPDCGEVNEGCQCEDGNAATSGVSVLTSEVPTDGARACTAASCAAYDDHECQDWRALQDRLESSRLLCGTLADALESVRAWTHDDAHASLEQRLLLIRNVATSALREAGRIATSTLLLAFLALPSFAAGPCKVNVNTASPAELQLFARTGAVLASRLASGRPYKALEAFDKVKGVGPSWLAVNGPHVALSGPTTCTEKIKAAPKVAAQAPKL